MEDSVVKILGIDPGLNKTGWGIISCRQNNISFVACGVIATDPKDLLAKRLNDIYGGISKVILDHRPGEVSIEETFVNNNPVSSLKLGHARGAAMLGAFLNQVAVFEYSTTAIKKAVVGVGRADKNQVSVMVKYLLPSSQFKSEDESDALASAICHSNHRSFNKILSLNK